MEDHDNVTRRHFLATGAAAAAALAAGKEALAQIPAPPQAHVKAVPGDIFIDHGFNQETRLETLRGYLTPASHFFVRKHAPCRSSTRGRGGCASRATPSSVRSSSRFDELLRLPSRSVICFLECAGNGRGFFKEFMGKVASGTQWRLGAIGVAEWTGVPLGAVLELARVRRDTPRDILNVLVEGLDSVKVSRPISLAKALEEDTLLAYAMNGEPVPADHGVSRAGHRPRLGRHQQHQVGRTHRGAKDRHRRAHHDEHLRARGPRPTRARCCYASRRSRARWRCRGAAMLPAGRHRVRGFAWSPVGRISRVE